MDAINIHMHATNQATNGDAVTLSAALQRACLELTFHVASIADTGDRLTDAKAKETAAKSAWNQQKSQLSAADRAAFYKCYRKEYRKYNQHHNRDKKDQKKKRAKGKFSPCLLPPKTHDTYLSSSTAMPAIEIVLTGKSDRIGQATGPQAAAQQPLPNDQALGAAAAPFFNAAPIAPMMGADLPPPPRQDYMAQFTNDAVAGMPYSQMPATYDNGQYPFGQPTPPWTFSEYDMLPTPQPSWTQTTGPFGGADMSNPNMSDMNGGMQFGATAAATNFLPSGYDFSATAFNTAAQAPYFNGAGGMSNLDDSHQYGAAASMRQMQPFPPIASGIYTPDPSPTRAQATANFTDADSPAYPLPAESDPISGMDAEGMWTSGFEGSMLDGTLDGGFDWAQEPLFSDM